MIQRTDFTKIDFRNTAEISFLEYVGELCDIKKKKGVRNLTSSKFTHPNHPNATEILFVNKIEIIV
jgi:hypothetical protein